MPADKQLGSAIRSDSGSFSLTDHRMSPKIDSILFVERTCSLDVITFHRDLAEVMQQRCGAKRSPIMPREVKELCYLVGDRRDTNRMRILISLEAICGSGELEKGLFAGPVDQIHLLNSRHSYQITDNARVST